MLPYIIAYVGKMNVSAVSLQILLNLYIKGIYLCYSLLYSYCFVLLVQILIYYLVLYLSMDIRSNTTKHFW